MSNSILRTIAACALLAPMGALATPITVDFTITATKTLGPDGVFTPGGSYAGFPTGTEGGGSFTFDDSLGTGWDTANGLPTIDLNFNWLGESFTEVDATVWLLSFNSVTGALESWGIGRRGGDPGCAVNCVSTIGPTDFQIDGFTYSPDDAGYMHVEGFQGTMFGATTWTVGPAAVGVPEPGTLALFGAGLLGILVTRRKRIA